jgi:hypothetical protein
MLQQSSADIVAGLSAADRAAVAVRMAKIERALERRGKLASWLLWILDEPRVRDRIKEIANGHD